MRNFLLRGVSLLYVTTFAPAAIEKFLEPETPKWFLDQFTPTLLGVVPGLLPLQFYGIGILEGLVSVLMVVALLKKNSEAALQIGLALAFVVFMALAFGQRLSHKFDGAAQLFAYAAFTILLLKNLGLKELVFKRKTV
jgi:hypothetical protein